MNCEQTQQLWDDLAEGRLVETKAAEVQRHLADCSDCRVARQRAARLRQLLSLKRYETPGPAYFDGFLGEFHRRLVAEEAKTTWLQKLLQPVSFDSPAWRYGLAASAAASLLVAAGLHWQRSNQQQLAAEPHVLPSATQMVAVAAPTAPVVAVISSTAETSHLAAGVVLTPAAPNASSTPRYVLDRITITPASYEPGSVRF